MSDCFSKVALTHSCSDHETVDAFHKAALEAGGTCNGAPGLRPQYHPNYYGAFVIDPLGNNVEVVSRASDFLNCNHFDLLVIIGGSPCPLRYTSYLLLDMFGSLIDLV